MEQQRAGVCQLSLSEARCQLPQAALGLVTCLAMSRGGSSTVVTLHSPSHSPSAIFLKKGVSYPHPNGTLAYCSKCKNFQDGTYRENSKEQFGGRLL